jgi:hypothetical protein
MAIKYGSGGGTMPVLISANVFTVLTRTADEIVDTIRGEGNWHGPIRRIYTDHGTCAAPDARFTLDLIFIKK